MELLPCGDFGPEGDGGWTGSWLSLLSGAMVVVRPATVHRTFRCNSLITRVSTRRRALDGDQHETRSAGVLPATSLAHDKLPARRRRSQSLRSRTVLSGAIWR